MMWWHNRSAVFIAVRIHSTNPDGVLCDVRSGAVSGLVCLVMHA